MNTKNLARFSVLAALTMGCVKYGPSLLGDNGQGTPSTPGGGGGDDTQVPGRTVLTPVTVTCSNAGTPFGGGDGSAGAPFAICSVAQLQQVNAGATGDSYVLASDIDLSSVGNLTTILVDGHLDGNRHTISGFNQSRSQTGLFAVLAGATVKDLALTLGTMENLGASGSYGGTFARENAGTISGCSVTGHFLLGNGGQYGGFVGNLTGTLENSYAQVSFEYIGNVGGVAYISPFMSNINGSGVVRKSYAVSSYTEVNAPGTHPVDGFNADFALNGTTGDADASFWDTTTSGIPSSGVNLLNGSAGLTTAQMQTTATYTGAGWSTTDWYFKAGEYPKFNWQP